MINALELFENFKNNQAKRALIQEQLRLSPLKEQVLRFGLAKDQAAMERDEERIGILSRRQSADENFQQRRLGIMAQASANRGRGSQRPAMAQIVDPLDPTKMISVDANVFNEEAYRKGNRTGVIGVAGREPATLKREEKAAEGKDLLASELDNLRVHYQTLNKAQAIPSSGRGAMSNLGSSIQASGVGQLAGRTFGTKEQDARNQIQSSRLRIMNAIKSATGMSAQQMNSNVELQTWLNSLTDPSRTYESNIGIIDAIDDAFVKGKGSLKNGGKVKTPTTPAATPDLKSLLDKYR